MTTTSAIVPDEIKGQMRAGESDLAPDFYYVAPASEGRSYDKVMIDPIIYFAPLEQRRTISPEDRQTLLNNFHILMGRRLGNDFLLSTEPQRGTVRSDEHTSEHTSELQSLMRTSYAVFCLK